MKKNMISILLLVTGPIFFLLEGITASSWVHPTYSYLSNWVSDLGVPTGLHTISSPLYGLMNLNFILFGLLFLIDYYLLSHFLDQKLRRIGVFLALFMTFGTFLVSAFPGYPWQGQIFHLLGALLVFIFAASTMIVTGRTLRKNEKQKTYGIVSILMGLITLTSLVLTLSGMYPASISGAVERLGLYPIVLWPSFMGTFLYLKK